MSTEIFIPIIIVSMLLVLATGLPVTFTIGGLFILFGAYFWGVGGLMNVAYIAWTSMSNLVLVAVPLFIFMGYLLQRSGLAHAIYYSLHLWLGFMRGGLAMATIMLCTMMAAMTGTVGAGVITASALALPEMRGYKYDNQLAYGSIMAGGGLGVLIPPSIPMLVYASVSRISVGRLFAGGVVPGLVLSALYMSSIAIRCALKPSLGPVIEEKATLQQKVLSLRGSFLAGILIVIVLGSIFMGIATPTESAAVGCLTTLIIAAIYRKLNWTVIKKSAYEAMKVLGMLVWIFIAATCFGQLFLVMGGHGLVQKLALGFVGNPWVVLIGMQVSLIALGMLFDDLIIILICAPIYTPIAMSLGFDPLWFALLFLINLQMALLTPPYGFAIYYMKISVPEESFGTLARSILPFFGTQIVGLILCMVFPQLILWLPNLLIR